MNKKTNAQKWYSKFEQLLATLPDHNHPRWNQLEEVNWLLALEALLDQHTHTEQDETILPF